MASIRRKAVEVKFDEESLDKLLKVVEDLDKKIARLGDLVLKADAVAEKARKVTADLNKALDRAARIPFSGPRT